MQPDLLDCLKAVLAHRYAVERELGSARRPRTIRWSNRDWNVVTVSGALLNSAPTLSGMLNADQLAFPSNRFVLQTVYDHLRKHGSWPRVRQLALALEEHLDPLGGLQQVCIAIGSDKIICGSRTASAPAGPP